MRIVGGSLGGRALAPVGKGDKGAHLRPTSDRVRENLFNMLTGGRFGDPVSGAVVLDLFAGTGALGLEALSRGAAQVTFVDDGRAAATLIRRNVALCEAQDRATLIARDATRLPGNTGAPATLVFLDPPYGKGLGARALGRALAAGWIAPVALIVWEESTAQGPPAGFVSLDGRRYGDSWITVLRRQDGEPVQ